MNNKLIICGFLVLVLAGFCLAQQEDLPKPGAVPGDLFYGLDRAAESIQLAFTRNGVKKGELHLKFAEERLAELDKVVEKNKTKHVEKLTTDEEQEVEKAQEELQKATGLGQNTTLLSQHIAEMTYKHILVLQRVLEKAPEQAKDSILHAINVSQNGYQNALARIERETGKPAEVPKVKPEETPKKPENETEISPPTEEQTQEQKGGGIGKLNMQITDKPPVKNTAGENITALELTISSIKVHMSGEAVDGTECIEVPYIVLKCTNETKEEDSCTKINITQEVCVNETEVIGENCTDAECVNGTFVDTECVNGTLIPEVCVNITDIVLKCENETDEEDNCTKINVTSEKCENETKYNESCTNVTGGTTAGWKTLMNTSKTFDLIELQGVKELLGNISLETGKYAQIRVYLSGATVTINGVKQSLKVPSGALKLIHPFTITDGGLTTLTLDFDAGKSVHKAGTKYMMKPVIKIIQG
jgi:hypothetical protein